MEERESLVGVLKTISRWKKYIIYTCGAVALGSIILTLFMRTYYKAEAVFFPANPYLSSPKNIFGGYEDELYYFGGGRELDQMLSIANSSALSTYMVKRFDLYTHYKIDSTKAKAGSKVRDHFSSLYKVIKNDREAIEMYVEDKDPVFAAEMANGVLDGINFLYKEVLSGNRQSMLKTYENDIARRQSELDILTDSLTRMRKEYGIYDIGSLSENLPGMVLETESELAFKKGKLENLRLSSGVKRDSILYLAAAVQALESKLHSLTSNEEGGSINMGRFNEGLEKVRMLERKQQQRSATLQSIHERNDQLKAAFESETSSIVVIEAPNTPEVKSRPRRSMIVITACMIAFIFSVLGVLLFDQYKDVNWKEILNAG